MLALLVFLVLTTRWSQCDGSVDICQVCDCLPIGESPVQAFCVDKKYGDKLFLPTISSEAMSLELVYIYGIETVNFEQNKFETEKPLDLIIQNCSEVNFSDQSLNHLRSLVMTDVKVARLGVLVYSHLWSVILENIKQLTLDTAFFDAIYNVKIRNIASLTILPTQEERNCEDLGLRFSLTDSELNPVPEGALTVCGDSVTLERNTFTSVAEGGLQISAQTIDIANNHFKHLDKKVFNLSAPQIQIRDNYFDNLPAGALSDVSTIQDSFFTNNTIQEVDLGGVLLDMGWDMTVENNTINCDCASKRTSILNPKKDMVLLPNASHKTLQNIFLNNYCRLNCIVTLEAFSYALKEGDVCLTNNTDLEEEKLCNITIFPEYNLDDGKDQSLVSAASRTEFLVPLSIILLTILVTSSVCYGYKEMRTFKFVFNPHRSSVPKLPSE